MGKEDHLLRHLVLGIAFLVIITVTHFDWPFFVGAIIFWTIVLAVKHRLNK